MIRLAVLVLAMTLVGCAQQFEQTPASTAPGAIAPPAPTSARLDVEATVDEWCGSMGGCAYFVAVLGPNPLREVELVVDSDGRLEPASGLPTSLAIGEYTLRLSHRAVSDAVANGHREMGPVAASCSVDFVVSAGQKSVNAHGRFKRDECSVELSD